MGYRSYSISRSHTKSLAEFWNPTPGGKKLYLYFILQRQLGKQESTRLWSLQNKIEVPLTQFHLFKSYNFQWLVFLHDKASNRRNSRLFICLTQSISCPSPQGQGNGSGVWKWCWSRRVVIRILSVYRSNDWVWGKAGKSLEEKSGIKFWHQFILS